MDSNQITPWTLEDFKINVKIKLYNYFNNHLACLEMAPVLTSFRTL